MRTYSARAGAVFCLFACLAPAHGADVLAGLRKGHPRLMMLDADIQKLRSTMQSDPYANQLHARLVQTARKLLETPPVAYPGHRKRLLEESRTCLDRVYTLALLYRLDGTRSFFDRALVELRTVANFPDWAPHSFLDVSEMMHAVAIGYDWLYPELKPEDRELLRRAIVEKGIRVGLADYERSKTWTVAPHNSNTVGNSGIAIGALALADVDPELARAVLSKSLESVRLSMSAYAPDGGWPEGPMYWHYATRYACWMSAALDSALGTDFGLSDSPGFSKTGEFRIHSIGPLGQYFSFGDSHVGGARAWEMWWLARRFHQPVDAGQQKQLLDDGAAPSAMDLMYYQPGAVGPGEAGWAPDKVFAGINVGFLRSSWSDRKAVYLGIKGGNHPSVHHQADAGAFVMDAGGARWAADLGSDSYSLPGYFDLEPGGLRWTYYRVRTESHNTLLIDGGNQDPVAPGPVVRHEFGNNLSMVQFDLSKVNPGKTDRWLRTLSLQDHRYAIVRDEVVARSPIEVLWGMVTPAEVSCQGDRAELRQRGVKLIARIVSPAGARFDTISTRPPEPQDPNEGTRKLVVRLPGKVTQLNLVVALIPILEGSPEPPASWRPRLME